MCFANIFAIFRAKNVEIDPTTKVVINRIDNWDKLIEGIIDETVVIAPFLDFCNV